LVKDNLNDVGAIQKYSPLLLELQNSFLQIRALSDNLVPQEQAKDIKLVTKHALAALDYTLFAVEAAQMELPLTSVSASAAAKDVAENLRMLARAYDVELGLDITKTLEPVYANELALKGALYGLASCLITSRHNMGKRVSVVIAAQETTPTMQRLGVYSPDLAIGPSAIKMARSLAGLARAASPQDLNHSGLGLLFSDQLATALGSSLERFVHRGCKGIGFYVPMSNQLNLIK
jgi:hypothetical protein